MTFRRFAPLALLMTTTLGACGSSSGVSEKADGAADAPSDAAATCTHEDCVVPLGTIEAICPPTLAAATTDCPYAVVSTGACGALTHVAMQTIGPVQDCYYDAAGALVAAVIRSDAGFTKIAGSVPTEACPAATQVCDHATP